MEVFFGLVYVLKAYTDIYVTTQQLLLNTTLSRITQKKTSVKQ